MDYNAKYNSFRLEFDFLFYHNSFYQQVVTEIPEIYVKVHKSIHAIFWPMPNHLLDIITATLLYRAATGNVKI